MRANRSMPRASAASTTSSGHSLMVCPGLKSERPKPGRSKPTRRTPSRAAASWPSCASRREPGKPWKYRSGLPAGSPHSAQPSSRPSLSRSVIVSLGGGHRLSPLTLYRCGRVGARATWRECHLTPWTVPPSMLVRPWPLRETQRSLAMAAPRVAHASPGRSVETSGTMGRPR